MNGLYKIVLFSNRSKVSRSFCAWCCPPVPGQARFLPGRWLSKNRNPRNPPKFTKSSAYEIHFSWEKTNYRNPTQPTKSTDWSAKSICRIAILGEKAPTGPTKIQRRRRVWRFRRGPGEFVITGCLAPYPLYKENSHWIFTFCTDPTGQFRGVRTPGPPRPATPLLKFGYGMAP